MIDLLLRALLAVVVAALFWYVLLMIGLPNPIPALVALIVVLVALLYLLRGKVDL